MSRGNTMFLFKQEDITHDDLVAWIGLFQPCVTTGKGVASGRDGGKKCFITATSPNLTCQVFAGTPYSNVSVTANEPTKGPCVLISKESM